MKEFLFVIFDMGKETSKFIKVAANNECEAKDKFAKALIPYLDFSYSDIVYMIENQDFRIDCLELKDIVVV